MNHVRLSRRFALGAIVVLVLGLTPSVALGVAGHLVITGPTLVSNAAPHSYTVTARDGWNAVATDYTGSVSLNVDTGNTYSTLPLSHVFDGTEGGVYTFPGVELETGSRILVASDGSAAGTLAVTVKAAGAATHFVVSAPTPTSVGTAETVTVTAKDDFDTTDTGYTGRVHFGSTDPLGPTLPADFDFLVDHAGTHTFIGEVTFKSAGTWTISAADGGAPVVSGTTDDVVVEKGDQAVAFTSTNPGNASVGGIYTPTADATSGLAPAITIAGAPSSVCSISLGVVSFDGPGSCQIDADQGGDANWNPAVQVRQTVTVKNAQTIIIDSTAPGSAVVGDTYSPAAHATSTFAVAYSIDISTTAICSIDGSNVVHLSVKGTCKVNFGQAGDAIGGRLRN